MLCRSCIRIACFAGLASESHAGLASESHDFAGLAPGPHSRAPPRNSTQCQVREYSEAMQLRQLRVELASSSEPVATPTRSSPSGPKPGGQRTSPRLRDQHDGTTQAGKLTPPTGQHEDSSDSTEEEVGADKGDMDYVPEEEDDAMSTDDEHSRRQRQPSAAKPLPPGVAPADCAWTATCR